MDGSPRKGLASATLIAGEDRNAVRENHVSCLVKKIIVNIKSSKNSRKNIKQVK